MARIPQVTIGGGSDARAGIVNPTVGIPGTDVGAPIDLLEGFRQWAKEDELAKDNILSVQKQEEFKRQSLEAVSQLNPMDEDYSEKVRTALSEVQQNLLTDTGITSREVSEDLTFRLTAAMEGDVTTATVTRRAALAQEAIRTSDELGNATLENIRDNPANRDQYLSEFASQSARLNGAIPAVKVAERAAAFGQAALQAEVEGLALSGDIEGARALLAEEGGQLDPETNRTLGRRIREIQSVAQNDAVSSFNRQKADLEIAIIDATDGSTLSALRSKVEALDDQGALPGSLQETRSGLIRAIEAKQTAISKDAQKLSEALAARNAGTLHKPEEVDLVYEHEFAQMAAENGGQPDADAVLNHLAGFVSQTGRMPSRQKAFIENAETTRDPQQLASAALIDQRINELAPTAQTGAGARVNLTRAFMEQAGLDAQAAAERVIAQAPDKATLTQREKEFKEDIFPDFDASDFMNQEVFRRGFVERNLPFFGSDDVDVPPAIAREAEKTFSLFYSMTGDEDTARTAAANAMQRKYGISKVGRDVPVATAYPVERHYFSSDLARVAASQPELQSRIITSDIEDAIAQTLGFRTTTEGGKATVDLGQLNIPDAPPGLEGVPPYALVSDFQTERSLASGGQGSWEVRVRDDYGNLVPLRVMTAQGSVNLRIVAPTDAEVRAMPAWQDHIKTEEDTVRFRSELQRDLAASPLGGSEGAALADQILGDSSEPARQAIPTEAVQEPEDAISSLHRTSPPPTPRRISSHRGGSQGSPVPFPRGIFNMNPTNMDRTHIKWEGMAEDQSGDDRFIVFSEPKYGIRAAARNLRTFLRRDGLSTIEELITKWAPKKENNTKAYIDAVAKQMGVARKQRLDLENDNVMKSLLKAIIYHENGVQPYADSVLDEGIKLERD